MPAPTSSAGVDAFMRASLLPRRSLALDRKGTLLPPALPLPNFTRWHVTTQDRLLFHLRQIWSGTLPRVGVDLGSHSSHSAFANVSDALLFLDVFHANGSIAIGVDVFEDFAQDLQRRMNYIQPYASMEGVVKRSLQYAIVPDQTPSLAGRSKSFTSTARTHLTCCADHWCHYRDEYEARRKADHLCRISRMRLGLIPPAAWLPPSSYPLETTRTLAQANLSADLPWPRYNVPTTTLIGLWRAQLARRRIDFLKVRDVPGCAWRSSIVGTSCCLRCSSPRGCVRLLNRCGWRACFVCVCVCVCCC